ncbi:MAG: purine-nucleoside phosphorylase [Verrucomicrobiia bacterium]|jgi:purine-nucleoside phosphorylase
MSEARESMLHKTGGNKITTLSVEEPASYITSKTKLKPALGIILGSGFQSVLERCTYVLKLNYSSIPGFIKPGVAGHKDVLVIGYLHKTPVIILGGRLHYYEGYPMSVVTFPVRVLAAIGVKTVLLTNAAGGINKKFKPGDFMCIKDHINFMGTNPLIGPVEFKQKRFIDLTNLYESKYIKMMKSAAKEAKVTIHEGVYLAVSGPSYETPAEVRAFSALGADAVGMSTVPEAIVAKQCGLEVAGLTCITNPAAGLNKKPISHSEVLEIGEKMSVKSGELVENFARIYANYK